mgnify:CR=1 FL=1
MINLSKGGRINLSKESNNGLEKLFFGSNWGAIKHSGFLGIGSSVEKVDLDSSVLMYDSNKNCIGEVAYYNLSAPGIRHSGDDRSGDVDGNDGLDNETIEVHLNELNPKVEYLAFILNNFTHQSFGNIPYMGLRIYTADSVQRSTNAPVNVLAKFNLEDGKEGTKIADKQAVILGIAYKKDGEWRFKAIGEFGGWHSINEMKRPTIAFL